MLENWKVTFRVLNSHPPSLYGHVSFSSLPTLRSVRTDHRMSMLHAHHEVSGWPNKRAWEQILDSWPALLEFGLINDPVAGDVVPRQKWPNEWQLRNQSCFFVIPKVISVIPFPYNYLVSYPLSPKFFCQLSLIPKTPNRASIIASRFRITPYRTTQT